MSRNKFNLKLPLDEGRDNEELINILPSYQMYRNTISKNLTPTIEDLRLEPPLYDQIQPFQSAPTSPEPELDDDNQETILENAHRLKRLTSLNKEVAKSLHVTIHLTKSIGKPGETYSVIDPLSVEYKQGDSIYGVVLVTNKTQQPIPFDMFTVQLEGVLSFGNSNNTLMDQSSQTFTFLTMFDFNASWNDGFLDRLKSDHNNPYKADHSNSFDPSDNTYYHLDPKKVFQPGVTYKKFFAFVMPERLLENGCQSSLIKHLQVPPTLGVSKSETISSLRHKWKGEAESKKYASITNDLSFTDASISYAVSARVIGRAGNYKQLLGGNHSNQLLGSDEYVVANEDYVYIRVIPVTQPVFSLNRAMINQEAKLLYSGLVEDIKQKMATGKEMTRQGHGLVPFSSNGSEQETNLHPTSSSVELSKMRQMYKAKKLDESKVYEVFYPIKKKPVFGASKVAGMLALATPRKEYVMEYVSPPRYPNHSATTLHIPLDIVYVNDKRSSPPEFRSISVELVSLTVKSKKHPIPIVIHPEMLFENKTKGTSPSQDNFDVLTIKRFQNYALHLSKLMKEAPELEVEPEMIKSIKGLAGLTTKYVHLKVQNVGYESGGAAYASVNSIPWEKQVVNSESTTERFEDVKYVKQLIITANMGSLEVRPMRLVDFCLVPDFQNCLIARIYYLKIDVRLQNSEKISLRVPVILQRSK
ncbi:Bul1 N terminus family protein [Candida parapsilosis]|uniref:Bul1 N-terminal domain-containing protein n=2 Tax=Candida parapsilosis TaxID=5480 RepID=G8BBD4_CANPC|nr:uncharacterized protein CPAR2_800010 [Candida parapsilosis]KAF6051351.1 Bul1 N terminus family protein [Candida parapsilosis]KAF6053152.1 Bul1 N terminus family protein [Candida parapsilosis]KAF6053153.1 Bul1 N terminus family protein [Candida parapsilosis]KAF6064930.1 Bul1 N terminus family protein [Candida parapsilosis]KAI5910811.1 hypothetical protein K4G61_g4512 [Candida parapsilosis]